MRRLVFCQPAACIALMFVFSALSAVATGADEFVAPPKAERDALAAIAKLGGRAQVDGEYRILSLTLGTECTNEELKGLAACERLTNLSISSPKITDAGLEHLKGLTKLTSMTITTSGLTTEGIGSLRTALPNCRITSFGRGGGPPGTGGPGRGLNGGDPFALPSSGGGSYITGTRITSLARNTEVQNDLQLTPEQRTKITAETATTTILRAIDEKVLAVLTAEQQARMKQLELQQAGMTALTREDIVAQLKVTAEQVAAIQKQNEESIATSRTALSEIFSQQRNTAEDTAKINTTLREKSTELKKQQEEKVLALLSEEQRKAWQALVGPKGPDVSGSLISSRFSERVPFAATTPAAAAKIVFDRYDTDKDGSISDAEFPTSNRTRTLMTAAGITLVYPAGREVFESNYIKYLEGGRGDRRR